MVRSAAAAALPLSCLARLAWRIYDIQAEPHSENRLTKKTERCKASAPGQLRAQGSRAATMGLAGHLAIATTGDRNLLCGSAGSNVGSEKESKQSNW